MPDIVQSIQPIVAGLYTPTLTGVANVDASTAYRAHYIRVGSIVHVTGKVDVDPTTAATFTQLGISFPVASNVTAADHGAGCINSNGGNNGYGTVYADGTNKRAEAFFFPSVNTNQPWFFTFSYRIV